LYNSPGINFNVQDFYMPINIIEFKARVADHESTEKKLLSMNPIFKGEDHQVDTYFNVLQGRLKLREGIIENALIWYDRPDDAGSKQSKVLLHKHVPDPSLKEMLEKLHTIKAVVDKKRKIYFIDNVKFHFDEVKGLGKFIEVEAIDETGDLGLEKIREQCNWYAQMFGIKQEDYVSVSYSDMILQLEKKRNEFPVLTTARLLLRQILPGDINDVFRGLSHPAVIKHYGVSFSSLEATQVQMDWYANMIKDDSGRCWAICSADNQVFYGVVTLVFWKKEHRKAETGYWIFPGYWGQGIVSEALEKVINYGFTQMNLHRISAESEDDNGGSIGVLKKLGFTYEGTMKECEIKEGRFINLDLYAKLRRD
jgi:ribosomal-protein-alanine N-acetyltransferase